MLAAGEKARLGGGDLDSAVAFLFFETKLFTLGLCCLFECYSFLELSSTTFLRLGPGGGSLCSSSMVPPR